MYKKQYRRGFYGKNKRYQNNRKSSPTLPVSKYVKKAEFEEVVLEPKQQMQIEDISLDATLKKNILQKGYTHFTDIQEGTIQPILEGKDVIGIANTGTGKTAAFLIPLLDQMMKGSSKKVLVIVPTRELAMQIREELKDLARSLNIYAALCIGGSSMRNQMFELRRNPQFVIGTPGRLKDLIDRKILKLETFNTIVLDEVDRMLDMGFINDIRYLISLLPSQRHSLFFSATLSHDINTLIQSFVKDPVTISVKQQETAANVDQDIVRVQPDEQKIEVLHDLLIKDEFKKVLIFGRTKAGVDRLSRNLYDRGFRVASIHGDKTQMRRNQAIQMFREDRVSILVATDVASRGIDIRDITHVINYDQPATYEDYIHRIGRTGRANKKGYALTFVG